MTLSTFRRAAAFVLSFAAVTACSDPVDVAAKKRIFSPEDPPKVISSALEKLPADQLSEMPPAARRVLAMSAAEATERLGAHRFAASVGMEWLGAGRTYKLTENRVLVAGRGGVSGDFHAIVENAQDQGLEVIRVDGQVYARSRYGQFRQRLRDRGMAEKEREEVFGALRQFDSLFRGQLALESQGPVTFQGRSAWKYSVGLGPEGFGQGPSRVDLPASLVPKGGRDEGTKRRLAFFEHRVPKSVRGELVVDSETGVVLRAKLDGRMQVPKSQEAEEAGLRLTLDATIAEVGREQPVRPPKDFLPDQDKPQGIADALERFGLAAERKGRDAGTAEPEPQDDDT